MLYKKRWIILSTSFLALIFTFWFELFLQRKSSLIGGGLNRSFLFLLINLHIIIIAVLLYVIIKQCLKLLIERRREIPGNNFKRNLFFAFIFLSVIPSLFVFFTAGSFITTSIEKWFQVHIEQGLRHGLQLHAVQTEDLRHALRNGSTSIKSTQYRLAPENKTALSDVIKQEVAQWRTYRIHNDRSMESLRRSFIQKIQAIKRHQEHTFDFYGSLYYIHHMPQQIKISIYRYPKPVRNHLIAMQNALDDYAELKSMQQSIYKSYYFSFALVVLLILLLATWCSFFLAKGISTPIQHLLEATENIRRGNLSVMVDPHTQSDLKPLAIAFNAMTKGIQQAQQDVENRNKEMVAIVESINDSVFYIDHHGRILTFNRAAKELFNKITPIDQLKYKKISFLPAAIRRTCFLTLREFLKAKQNTWSKEIAISLHQEYKILMVHLSKLDAGILIVIQDLTEIVKLSKIKAWQEAAKQVAHEIKNPLTPIQLATQRLQRKYQHLFNQEPAFADCTNTILDHVSIIKDLASHFSQFASMPAPSIALIDINKLIKETLQLYQLSYPDIVVSHTWDQHCMMIKTDQEKIKQVLINLLDNSIRALLENPQKARIKKISIHTEITSDQHSIMLSFSDNGPGIDKTIHNNLFLPYVSTNKKNMGLGLAIVHDIIRQLGGTIRLVPSTLGAHFTIKLPYT